MKPLCLRASVVQFFLTTQPTQRREAAKLTVLCRTLCDSMGRFNGAIQKIV